MILLKNIYRGKTAEDIWTSLILSLPAEEITKMVPPCPELELPVKEKDKDIMESDGEELDDNIEDIQLGVTATGEVSIITAQTFNPHIYICLLYTSPSPRDS